MYVSSACLLSSTCSGVRDMSLRGGNGGVMAPNLSLIFVWRASSSLYRAEHNCVPLTCNVYLVCFPIFCSSSSNASSVPATDTYMTACFVLALCLLCVFFVFAFLLCVVCFGCSRRQSKARSSVP